MKISEIEITHHRLPLHPPFEAAWDSVPRAQFDATIVRVRTDEGLEGIGSGDAMVGFDGHQELFLGHHPLEIERHWRVLSNLDFHYGRPWPLDLALWDLAGKITGQPVWRLLGGLSDRIVAYASTGTRRDSGEMAEAAERLLSKGFKAMKVRFRSTGSAATGETWRTDIAALEAVRKRIGDRLAIMVDCNQGWRMPWDTGRSWTFKEALAVARELERLDIYWMEEPLDRCDITGSLRLRDSVDIRIAGGEMTRDLSQLREIVTSGALDVLQPDAALVGGITGLKRIATMTEDHGLIFTPHTWTNGIGVIANAHLTAGLVSASYLEFPFDPPEWGLDRRDFMLTEPFEIDAEGRVVLSEQPGLGIHLDEDTLASTRIG